MSPEAARGALMLGLRAKWRGVSQAGHPLFASASPVWLSVQALPDLREVGGVVGQGLCKAGGGGAGWHQGLWGGVGGVDLPRWTH